MQLDRIIGKAVSLLLAACMAFPVTALAQGKSGGDNSETTAAADIDPDAEPEPQKKKRKKQRKILDWEDPEVLSQIARRADRDLHFKDNVAFRKSWAFQSGVTDLYLPYYEGWLNASDLGDLHEFYTNEAFPGEQLASILVNRDYMKRTGAPYANFVILVWVPAAHAY